jgi:hypothetical protein
LQSGVLVLGMRTSPTPTKTFVEMTRCTLVSHCPIDELACVTLDLSVLFYLLQHKNESVIGSGIVDASCFPSIGLGCFVELSLQANPYCICHDSLTREHHLLCF